MWWVLYSETKWFGNAIYDVDGYLILHSGHPVPGVGERVERNEGVGLVLDLSTAESWRDVMKCAVQLVPGL